MVSNTRKGFALVEATILYPLIIGAVMAVIYIIICLYIGAAMKANLNIELRNEAANKMQTGEKLKLTAQFKPEDKYGRGAFNQRVFFSEKELEGHKILFAQASHTYSGNAMMAESIARTHQGTIYLIDERDYIRKADMIFE